MCSIIPEKGRGIIGYIYDLEAWPKFQWNVGKLTSLLANIRHKQRSSIARKLGIDIGETAPVDRHVEGIVEMKPDATQLYDKPLTKDRLFGWHAAMFPTGRSGLRKITVDAWTTPETATSYS